MLAHLKTYSKVSSLLYLKFVFIILPKTRQIKYLYFLHNPELLASADCTAGLEHPSDCVHWLKIRTHKILLTITVSIFTPMNLAVLYWERLFESKHMFREINLKIMIMIGLKSFRKVCEHKSLGKPAKFLFFWCHTVVNYQLQFERPLFDSKTVCKLIDSFHPTTFCQTLILSATFRLESIVVLVPEMLKKVGIVWSVTFSRKRICRI